MKKLANRKSMGRSIFAFIALALIGLFVYVNYQAAREAGPGYSNPKWKTAVLTYEQITYQYPPSWTITDNSRAQPQSEGDCSYPGQDLVTLTSPSKARVVLETGQVCPGPVPSKSWGSVKVRAFNIAAYLVLEAALGAPGSGPTQPTSACIAPNRNPATTSGYESKNIFVNHTVASNALVYNSFCYIPPVSASQPIEQSADFTTAKEILETLHY